MDSLKLTEKKKDRISWNSIFQVSKGNTKVVKSGPHSAPSGHSFSIHNSPTTSKKTEHVQSRSEFYENFEKHFMKALHSLVMERSKLEEEMEELCRKLNEFKEAKLKMYDKLKETKKTIKNLKQQMHELKKEITIKQEDMTSVTTKINHLEGGKNFKKFLEENLPNDCETI
jgi:chromosome segregation ATPase